MSAGSDGSASIPAEVFVESADSKGSVLLESQPVPTVRNAQDYAPKHINVHIAACVSAHVCADAPVRGCVSAG